MQVFNPNPTGRNVGDCAIRAIAKALSLDWKRAYLALCIEGMEVYDLPNSNAVWGRYLAENGYSKHSLDDSCVEGYTVKDFMRDNPSGTFVLALPGHVVCVEDGELWDSWDSSNEIVLYCFRKDE